MIEIEKNSVLSYCSLNALLDSITCFKFTIHNKDSIISSILEQVQEIRKKAAAAKKSTHESHFSFSEKDFEAPKVKESKQTQTKIVSKAGSDDEDEFDSNANALWQIIKSQADLVEQLGETDIE